MNHHKLAKELALGSIVLLKNKDRCLPLQDGAAIAFFGRSQLDTYYSGNGSGAARSANVPSILSACEQAGIVPVPELKAFYEQALRDEPERDPNSIDWENAAELFHSGVIYELFGQYHPPKAEPLPPDELIRSAAREADTALLVLGRNAGGEECDRHLVGDYTLTDSEMRLSEKVCTAFASVILLLNVNGQIDLGWAENLPNIKSIIFFGIPGEAGAEALAELLIGNKSPSGKLAFTFARRFGDYPNAEDFSFDKDDPAALKIYQSYGIDKEPGPYAQEPVTVYREDIYLGYRYFDSFAVEPLYPFGFGLSYTDFSIHAEETLRMDDGLLIRATVKNIGTWAGQETVQLYLSAQCSTPRAVGELKGFQKTGILQPGETQGVELFLPWTELACYHEKQAAWIIDAGDYVLLLGNSSRSTERVTSVHVFSDILIEQCVNRLQSEASVKDEISFLQAEAAQRDILDEWEHSLIPLDVERQIPTILEEKVDPLVKSLTTEELTALCVGYGPGTAFSAFGDGNEPNTIADEHGKDFTTNSHPTGHLGYVSPAIEEKGIHSIFYKDGPAGVGAVAWPTEMLLACSFDTGLWTAFGDAIGAECEKQQVDVWLGPAVNLQRHPLCGRNFEYFSEDPFLTTEVAAHVVRGLQEHHRVLACPKHFAANEQETYRRGSAKKNIDAADSILTERAARELYLKPFEKLVRQVDIHVLMSSFNKINGIFAAGSGDLCSGILRDEWGFDGIVVTDWGDMDVVVDGADAVCAGNDIVMPGGPPVIAQLQCGLEEGRLSRDDLERAVGRLLRVLRRLGRVQDASI